jgi:hypothetical protein
MNITLSRPQTNKIALILLLMAISVPLFLFNGTLDDFVPKHIAKVEETSYNGKLIVGENQVIQVPGFYTLGTIITLFSGFASENLIFFPIQLIPYAILFFTVLYRVSGSSIVASLITLINLCSGTDGTGELFFWPHGIGYILFFTMLLLIFILLKKERFSKQLIFLAIITVSCLVYISYNLTAMTLLVLAVIVTLYAIFYLISLKSNNTDSRRHLSSSKTFFTLLLILWVVQLGLSKFVYGVFIPLLQATQDLEMSSLDKFFVAYINPELSATPLSPIMVSYPVTISVINGIKYILLAATILIFCIVIINIIIKKKSLDRTSLFVLAVLLMQGLYSIPRFIIGGIVVSSLWLPGVLCVGLFSGMSKKLMVWAVVVLSVILICTPLNYCIMDSNGYIDRDEYQFTNYKAPVHWFFKTNGGNIAVSDELTNDFFILNSFKYSIDHGDSSPNLNVISKQHRILPTEDAQVLAQLSDGTLDTKYYVLNQKLTRMSLQNWIIIKSWRYSRDRVNCNDQINKIYEVPLLSIYYSS